MKKHKRNSEDLRETERRAREDPTPENIYLFRLAAIRASKPELAMPFQKGDEVLVKETRFPAVESPQPWKGKIIQINIEIPEKIPNTLELVELKTFEDIIGIRSGSKLEVKPTEKVEWNKKRWWEPLEGEGSRGYGIWGIPIFTKEMGYRHPDIITLIHPIAP